MRVLAKSVVILFSLLFLNQCLAKPLTVVLDWFVNPNHAPIVIAEKQGFFKQRGVSVNLIMPADPSEPVKWVATGKADIAVDYEPHLLIVKSSGLPLTQVSDLIDHSLNVLVVLEDSPVHELQELRGKKIGYSSEGFVSTLLQAMLKSQGVALHDVSLINVHYGLTQALLTGQVDAVVGMLSNYELPQLQLAGHPGRAYYPKNYGVPDYAELVFVTRTDRAHDHQVTAFLAAINDAIKYIQHNSQQAWQQFIESYPELDNKLNHIAWQKTVPLFTQKVGQLNPKRCSKLAKFLSLDSRKVCR